MGKTILKAIWTWLKYFLMLVVGLNIFKYVGTMNLPQNHMGGQMLLWNMGVIPLSALAAIIIPLLKRKKKQEAQNKALKDAQEARDLLNSTLTNQD